MFPRLNGYRVSPVDNDMINKNRLYDEEHYLRFDAITNIEFGNGPAGKKNQSSFAVAITVLGIILVLDALGVGDAN